MNKKTNIGYKIFSYMAFSPLHSFSDKQDRKSCFLFKDVGDYYGNDYQQ